MKEQKGKSIPVNGLLSCVETRLDEFNKNYYKEKGV